MMQVVINPTADQWSTLLQRPYTDNTAVRNTVQDIIIRVKQEGDAAVKAFTQQFDGVSIEQWMVSDEEHKVAADQLSLELKKAIYLAKNNIEAFHKAQVSGPKLVETMPGVKCWRKGVGIERVGLYIPGGTAPLFSTVLMLGIPAQLAGCNEIIVCTPCDKEGAIHPAILYAAELTGIHRLYKMGGAQAIAAMAYGTESVPQVYKIFGPGNQYVTAAKQLVQLDGIAIDMPAGPSEVCVVADETANPAFIAADLLSQAEHGVDSQVLLISPSEKVVQQTIMELQQQLELLPRKAVAQKALANSKAIVIGKEHIVDIINQYAAEHLIICCEDAEIIAGQIINAGSVFIGNYSPESVGDYASGTNHTLPTNGFARAYSGVSVDSFQKKITFQQLTKEGLHSIASTVTEMAMAEGLQAHAQAVQVRL